MGPANVRQSPVRLFVPCRSADAEEDAIAEGDDFDEEEEAERDEDADKNTDTKDWTLSLP